MSALILVKAEFGLTTKRQRHIRSEMNTEAPLEGARLRIEARGGQLGRGALR
jgi:hypothetical protein